MLCFVQKRIQEFPQFSCIVENTEKTWASTETFPIQVILQPLVAQSVLIFRIMSKSYAT